MTAAEITGFTVTPIYTSFRLHDAFTDVKGTHPLMSPNTYAGFQLRVHNELSDSSQKLHDFHKTFQILVHRIMRASFLTSSSEDEMNSNHFSIYFYFSACRVKIIWF